MTKTTQYTVKSSVMWSTIERFSSQGVQFVVSIIIARLLMPADYGIIGMTAIFIGISQAFVDCGFSTALIRKQDRTEIDNSTIFFVNIIVGIILYILLWISAPLIAEFYSLPILVPITRAVSLTLFFNSLQIVPRAILTANADFKTQTYASLPATVVSGALGIYLAYNGYGVWALVWQQIISGVLISIILWILSKWHPILVFSFESLKELFRFSSNLLVSGLIDTIWNNSYTLVIGKFFAAKELGFYTRAYTLGYFPSVNIANVLQRGFFPILCRYQDDETVLVTNYRKFLKQSVYIVTPMMFGLAALADPVINLLLTSKWNASVPLLQILCMYFVLKPIVSINNNIYQVKGRSDMFLRLEIYKKLISIVFLISSIPFGVYWMCVASVVSELICTLINMSMASRIIKLSLHSQIIDILPFFIMSIIMFILIRIAVHFIPNHYLSLCFGILIGLTFYIMTSMVFKIPEFKQIIHLMHLQK